jgi:hypothetical protein
MPRRRADPATLWSRFGPPDSQDGIPPKRHALMDAWVRAGRLPAPPFIPSSPEQFSDEFESYVKELEAKGIKRQRLFALLGGMLPGQSVNLFRVTETVGDLAFIHGAWASYRRHLLQLWRHYRSALPLLEDRTLRYGTRKALREDLSEIFRVIRWFAAFKGFERTIRDKGITVVPTKDLSRQGFWTRPIVALVDDLAPILGSNERAYAATARLFHLLFGYPNKGELVKRRYLHARQKQTPPRRK